MRDGLFHGRQPGETPSARGKRLRRLLRNSDATGAGGLVIQDAVVMPLDAVDPRLTPSLLAELERRAHDVLEPLPRALTVVLAGHRAAGKSSLLPHVAALLGRPFIDLDAQLARVHGRPLREWFEADRVSFRHAEREAFRTLPRGVVVAVGGGFLSHHPDALVGCVVVEVPITFQTYAERLKGDQTRPRLDPAVSLEQELREVFEQRTQLHRQARPMPLVDFLLRARRGERPARVVTLPPGEVPHEFAWRARHQGADVLEVRSDLTGAEVDLKPASRALPLLVAERGAPLPATWLALATFVDREAPGAFRSLHADRPLATADAVARWADAPRGTFVKHVEPLGSLPEAPRLFETRDALIERFGAGNVTVLATGPLALPFRAVLARRNAFDYLALDSSWLAAPGQRLLADARREWVQLSRDGEYERHGLLGHSVFHSRSPRIHQAPFDRIDLPEDVDLAAVLEALRPWYSGFAVTNPFKRRAARAVGATRDAVNTLTRTEQGWASLNSDVEGARRVLEALATRQITVLGDGGVGDALREAAGQDYSLRFLRRGDVVGSLDGTVIWTWPVTVEVPPLLRFAPGTRVAVVAYGGPAHAITRVVRSLGGTPLRLGPTWFTAQARTQRRHWAGT
jgi:shikimate kinase